MFIGGSSLHTLVMSSPSLSPGALNSLPKSVLLLIFLGLPVKDLLSCAVVSSNNLRSFFPHLFHHVLSTTDIIMINIADLQTHKGDNS